MDVSLFLNGVGWSYGELREVWQEAERLGFSSLWMADNVVAHGWMDDNAPHLDAWTVLPALAECTSTIRFGTLVSPILRRHPALLAKSAAVLDHIGDGRLSVGLGPSDDPAQFLPWGLPFPEPAERIAILREEIAIIRSSWTEPRTTFRGAHHSIDGAISEPKPLQRPGPPIWVGIIAGRTLMPRVAAELADGLNLNRGDDALVREVLDTVQGHCEAAGRDPAGLATSRSVFVTLGSVEGCDRVLAAQAESMATTPDRVRVSRCLIGGSPDQVVAGVQERVADLGIGEVVLRLQPPSLDVAELQHYGPSGPSGPYLDAMRELADTVLPALQACEPARR